MHAAGAALPQAAGEQEDIVLGGGADHRARVPHDDARQQRRLACPRRGQDQQMLLEADPHGVPVLRDAECDRVPGGIPGACPEAQSGPRPAGLAERGEAAPPEPQLRQARVTLAGTAPQPQPQPHGAHPVPRQAPVVA
jgi:hypothetical protein